MLRPPPRSTIPAAAAASHLYNTQALELAESLLGRFNENTASDLGVAGLSLYAGLRGAWLNVCINVGSLKDKTLAQDFQVRGEALLAKAQPLAERLNAQISQTVGA